MTPFKAMYGRDATAIHDYTSGSSTTESIDSSLIEHQRLLQLLKDALATSRQKMINQANKKRLHKEFQIGEFVYLRLQKHRQSSVHNRPNAKLAKRFFGPFKILERIGAVAYRLDLPPTSKVNPVFHVSLLKTCYETEPSSDIPPEWDTTPVTEHHPESILARRVSPEGTTQLLIKWTQLDAATATWEDINDLKLRFPEFPVNFADEVISPEEGIDTSDSSPSTATAQTSICDRPKRNIQKPIRFRA